MRLGVLVTAIQLAVVAPVLAQDSSKGEVSAGWRYHYGTIGAYLPLDLAEQPLGKSYPKGWYADGSFNLSPMFAVVGEVGGLYRSDAATISFAGAGTISESTDITLYTFLGGVRLRMPRNAKFVPFGQVLFGGDHVTSSYAATWVFNIPGLSVPSFTNTEDVDTSDAALALDGGITMAFGRIGARASAGYMRMFGDSDADVFRLTLGGVYRF